MQISRHDKYKVRVSNKLMRSSGVCEVYNSAIKTTSHRVHSLWLLRCHAPVNRPISNSCSCGF